MILGDVEVNGRQFPVNEVLTTVRLPAQGMTIHILRIRKELCVRHRGPPTCVFRYTVHVTGAVAVTDRICRLRVSRLIRARALGGAFNCS